MIARIAKQAWDDTEGFIISIELILISTICVIGLITGWTAVRDAVVSELADVAAAMGVADQSVSVSAGQSKAAGSSFVDQPDHCDEQGDQAGSAASCIVFSAAPINEGTGLRL